MPSPQLWGRGWCRLHYRRATLQELLQTLTEAPRDLALVIALQGESNALKLVGGLVQEQKFKEALHAWREARLTFLNSGVAGQGMILPRWSPIPVALQPRVIAALMFVEDALLAVGMDDNPRHATSSLLEAISRLQKLTAESTEEACTKRLERMIQRLREAIASIKNKRARTRSRLDAHRNLRHPMRLSTLIRWLRVSPQAGVTIHHGVIILAVAIPTTGLLFFMNRAMNGEGQKLLVQLNEARQAALDQALHKVREALETRVVEATHSNEATTDPAKRFHTIYATPDRGWLSDPGSEGAILYPCWLGLPRKATATFLKPRLMESWRCCQ